MNEMTTSDGKPAIKKADFNENGRKALGQTYINSPKTESGGNGGNDNNNLLHVASHKLENHWQGDLKTVAEAR